MKSTAVNTLLGRTLVMSGSLFWCGQHTLEDCPSTLHTPCIYFEYNLSVDMYLPLLFAAVIYRVFQKELYKFESL
jgi:hypothetical protein